jgi:ribosome-binding factor A
LKHHKRRSKVSEFVDDPDFAEALSGGESQRLSSERQAERKARQFCRQVQRALNLAFEGRSATEDVSGLFADEVSPAPDCGRLLVHVVIPEGRPVADSIAALQRDSPRLRSEVAMAITRKRAPELCFVPVLQDGGDND